jgi:hypothetical protein
MVYKVKQTGRQRVQENNIRFQGGLPMLIGHFRKLPQRVLRFALWLAVPGLLLSPAAPFSTAQEARIDVEDIVTLLPKDAVPAIRDPMSLLAPADMVSGVRDSDQILGVVIGGESRAYPVAFLSWHEIVNDTVGGMPIAATW